MSLRSVVLRAVFALPVLYASAVQAAVLVTITSPPAGQPVYNQPSPTITVTYSSDGPPLNLSTLAILVNGANWTSRFAVASGSATYTLGPADILVAGSVTVAASVADQAGTSGSASQTYTVYPTLQGVMPNAGDPGALITVSGLGLDPVVDRNVLRFPSLFSTDPIEAVFETVNQPPTGGTVRVPSEGRSGNVVLAVNGKASPESRFFTVRGLFPKCGDVDQIIGLADGSVLVKHWSYDNCGEIRGDPRCPVVAASPTGGGRAVVVQEYQNGSVELVRDSHPQTSYDRRVVHIAVDKTGAGRAVITADWDGQPIGIKLHIEYADRVTSIRPGLAPADAGGSMLAWLPWALETDFDRQGNLYIADYEWDPGVPAPRTLRLIKVSAETLAAGGDGTFVTVATGLGPVAPVQSFAQVRISCDGFAYVGTGAIPFGVWPPGQFGGIVRKIDLQTGNVVGRVVPPGSPTGLALTSNEDELLGTSLVPNNAIQTWRWGPSGSVEPLDFLPDSFGYGGAVTVAPGGAIYSTARLGLEPQIFRLRATVATAGQPSAQPHPCPPLTILADTTRWKPQRDVNTSMEVRFAGPVDLDLASVSLNVTPPAGGPATYTPTIGAVTRVPGTSDQYAFSWTGPWTFEDGGQARPLPRGNYQLTVRAQPQNSNTQLESRPYSKVSLVEVTQTRFQEEVGAPPLDTNPGPCPAPPGSDPGCTVPPSGLRIFAEALDPVDIDPSQPIYSRVNVIATIDPAVPDSENNQGPLRVYFRPLDVDDPVGTVDDETQLLDNQGPQASLLDDEGVEILNAYIVPLSVSGTEAATTMRVSRRQGDNYRVAASTASQWLANLSVVSGSQEGEVMHATDPTVPEGIQLSQMLTVWRTLHVERMEFVAPTPAQADLQVNGSWASLLERSLTDNEEPFYGWKTADGVPDHTAEDDWEGAVLNPNALAGSEFPVKENDSHTVEVSSGDLRTVGDPNTPQYYLRDDDIDSLAVLTHDTSMIERLMKQVFVHVVQMDPVRELRPFFVHNLSAQSLDLMRGTMTNSEIYWNVPLLLAFEDERSKDNDPIDMAGPTAGRCGIGSQPVAAIYAESIADFKAGTKCPNITPSISLPELYSSTTAHEILHALTLDHDGDVSGGIMCSGIKNYIDQPRRFEVTDAQRTLLRQLEVPVRGAAGSEPPSCPTSRPCE